MVPMAEIEERFHLFVHHRKKRLDTNIPLLARPVEGASTASRAKPVEGAMAVAGFLLAVLRGGDLLPFL